MIKKILGAAIAALLLVAPAAADNIKTYAVWYPLARLASPVSVTSASAATQLPGAGAPVAWICNTSTQDAFLKFGQDNTVTVSATTGTWLKQGTCGKYDVNPSPGVFLTWFAAITASSTTSLNVETGIGTPPGV